MNKARSEVENLDDARVRDPRCRVGFLHHVAALRAEQVEPAALGGHHHAADVADALPLRLEPDARGSNVSLIEAKPLRSHIAQVPLDHVQGHARMPPGTAGGS